jgi:iron complex outermembrane receptor protein
MRQRPLSISLRKLLFGGSTLLLLCSPSRAFGADAPPQDAAGSNAPASDPVKDVTQLGKITVTAQSRSQEMQEVPIPLQIVTAKQIDTLAATDLSRMDIFVPGLVVGADQPTQPSYQMRGIETSNFGIGTESAVGVYVDGVYAARSGGALLAFNDIARIEVLKGPQGTLFGRNAAAGAISIVTNEPSDHFEGKARVRFGNDGRKYADALVNVPVNRDMAVRMSVLDNRSDGWIKDAATGESYGKDHDWGSRLVWRWNATPDTRVLLAWDHEQLKQPPQPAIGLIAKSDYVTRPAPFNDQVPPFPADSSSYLDPRHAPLYNDTVNAGEKRHFDGATLTVDHSFSWGSLTSTTAWRHFNTYNRGDYDGTNNRATYLDTANIESNNSWYQEFKFAGTTGIADWVGGVSYYDEHARQTSQTNVFTDSVDSLAMNVGGNPFTDTFAFYDSVLPLLGFGQYHLLGNPWREQIDNVGRFKAYAAYGDVIWHLTDRLSLTTGARFTRDEKQFSWFNPLRQAPELDATIAELLPQLAALGIVIDPSPFQQNLIFNAAGGAPVNVLVKDKNSWNDFSPRVVLDYKFTPDVMGYASVTKGYKAGGYNSVQIGSRFDPEKVLNYEAGLKTLFPDQHLLLNGSVYYYRYDNKQSLTLDPNSAGSGVPRYLVSSTDQEAHGLEFEAQWQPVDAFKLSFTGAYIDATYRQAVAPSGADLSGQPTGEPLFSFASSLSYTWQGVAGGALEFDLSHAYRGKSRCNRDSQLQGTCQISPNFDTGVAQQRTDARLDWHAADDQWGVALYANNVFNKRYVTGVNNISTSVFGTPFASITPPRAVGVELRVKF